MKKMLTLPVVNATIALCFTALIGFTATVFAQNQPATAPPTSSETHFRIISISRSKVYPPPPNTVLRAKDGFVFIVVTYVPVPLKSVDDYPDDRDAFLVDSQGKKSGAVYTALVGNGKIPDNGVFVFSMSEGATPKEMILSGSPVDLSRVQQPPNKRPTPQPAK